MLPIHPQPLDDESLSSWITRLAIENGYYSHAFFSQVVNFKEVIFSRDVDRLNSPNLIVLLAKITGKPIEDILNLKISFFEGEVFKKLNALGNTRWILPLGIYHRTKLRKGMIYCPLCLREDKTRYFRKSWRLSFITFCYKHKCILLDHCNHCKSPIDFQRLGIGSLHYELPVKDIGLCFKCHKPLFETPIKFLDMEMNLISTSFENFLLNFDNQNSIIPALNQPFNLQIFDGLWVLVGRILSKRASDVRHRILKETGIKLSRFQKSFDYLPLNERLKVIIVILFYLEDWPNKFLELVKDTKFTLSAFNDNTNEIPFWLDSIIDQEMNRKQYQVSDEEIVNATKHLKKNNIYSKLELAKLLGIHISSLQKRLHRLHQNPEYSSP